MENKVSETTEKKELNQEELDQVSGGFNSHLFRGDAAWPQEQGNGTGNGTETSLLRRIIGSQANNQ